MKIKFPPLSDITIQSEQNMSDAQKSAISSLMWDVLHKTGVLSDHLVFVNQAKFNDRTLQTKRLELKRAHLSLKHPIPGVDPEVSKMQLHDSRFIHVGLEDQDGEIHGFNEVRKGFNGASTVRGVLLKDELENLWICASDDLSEPLTGNERLVRMNAETSPLMRISGSFQIGEDFDLGKYAPLIGTFFTSGPTIRCLGTDVRATHQEILPAMRAELDRVKSVLDARLALSVERESMISQILEKHLSDEALSAILPEGSGDMVGGLVPAHTDFDKRKAHDNRMTAFTMRIMEDLRAASLLGKCENNGPRNVSSLHAWNAWIDGKYDAEELTFEQQWQLHSLARSPAFSLLDEIISRTSISLEHDILAERHPDLGFSERSKMQTVIPAARIDELFQRIREEIMTTFCSESAGMHRMSYDGLQGNSDGIRYVLAGSFLTPTLALRTENYRDHPIELPPMDPPKFLRHMEIPMPSGVLIIDDWIRVKGFNEGLEALCGEDFYEINYESGLDLRARDYFEKAGICIIQVGNSSPTCTSDTPGIFRVGHFDEDYDIFWTNEGVRTDAPLPNHVFSTSTDLWANTFADRETVICVLEASGIYETREAAAEALHDYCAEKGFKNMVDLGVDRLHLYAPTGAGISRRNFDKVFIAGEVPKVPYLEDRYILSTDPLSVPSDLLEETEWSAPDQPQETPTHSPGTGK